MDTTKLKEEVLHYADENPGMSFIELRNILERHGVDCNGGFFMHSRVNSNIIFWAGMSKEFVDFVLELEHSNQLIPRACSLLIYMADGGMLRLPLLKRNIKVKNPHWTPIVFYTPHALKKWEPQHIKNIVKSNPEKFKNVF
jgi:hypothetical protein